MIPYLVIAAFCGLRAAEIARLDWSEVHLAGAEHLIEVKAAKAKDRQSANVPIPENGLDPAELTQLNQCMAAALLRGFFSLAH